MTLRKLNIAFIGAGNVATHLAPALRQVGHDIVAVYSRTAVSANALAQTLGTSAITEISNIPEADIYIYCVKDDALPSTTARVASLHPQSLHIHTSGSTDMHIFPNVCRHYGVLYPLQTFSKAAPLDVGEIPCFVEGNDHKAESDILALAKSICHDVRLLDSARRRYLHLAAVFACNFVNHCYAIAANIVKESVGLPYDILLPLIDETARKVHSLLPTEAQTGPAVRYDTNIIGRQEELLAKEARLKQIYGLLSESIHYYATQRSPQSPQQPLS